MIRAGIFLASVALLVAPSCQFQSDFSALKFSVDGTADVVSNDLVEEETSSPDVKDVVVPDSSVKPDVGVVERSCMEILNCVLFEERCLDFSDFSCPNACADTDDWESNGLFYKIYSALGSCQLAGSTDNEILPCLYHDNSASLVACVAEKPDEGTCSEAMMCMLNGEPSCGQFSAPKEYFGCIGRCVSGISAAEQKGIARVLGGCPGVVPMGGVMESGSGLLGEMCIEGLEDCFGSSGNRSCVSIVNCMLPSCLDCSALGDLCDPSACAVKCLSGASSEKAVEYALKSVAPALENGGNVFGGLLAFTECLGDNSGGRGCLAVMNDLEEKYKSGDPYWPDLYADLVATVYTIKNDDIGELADALNCLRSKWNETDMQLDLLAWQTCRLQCN